MFTAWGDWSACSLTCGNGTQSRNRSCEGPYFGGKNCTGDWGQTKDCNTFPCPGKYISNLFFFSVNDLDTPLIGRILIHVIFIFLHFILVDGFWLNWSNWSDCSKSCGRGFMYRTRVCEDPKYGGSECVGVSNETMPCNPSSCPGMYLRPSIAIVRFCAHLLLYMYIFINLQIVYPVLILSTYSIISFFKLSSICFLSIKTFEIISYVR